MIPIWFITSIQLRYTYTHVLHSILSSAIYRRTSQISSSLLRWPLKKCLFMTVLRHQPSTGVLQTNEVSCEMTSEEVGLPLRDSHRTWVSAPHDFYLLPSYNHGPLRAWLRMRGKVRIGLGCSLNRCGL